MPTRSTRSRRPTATGRGSRATSATTASTTAPRSSTIRRSALGGCGNSQMGPEKRWEFRDDLGWTMELGGVAPVEGRRRLQRASRSAATTSGRRSGTWTFPRDAEYNVNDRTTYPTQWVEHAADLRARSRSSTSRPTCRTTGRSPSALTLNLGLRYDVQFGSYNEDLDDLLGRIGEQAGPDVRDLPAADSVPSRARTRAATATTSGRASALAWDVDRRRPDQRPRRLRPVLREHAHAAELRRAHVAAEPADHHQQPELPGCAAGPLARPVRLDRAAQHHRDGQRQRQRLRPSVQHRRVAHGRARISA